MEKIRAFKCPTCFDWDVEGKCCKGKCEIITLDSYDEPICVNHRNKQNGKLTGGYKTEKKRQHVWFTSDWHFGHQSILYFYPERRELMDISLEELQTNKELAVSKMDEYLIKLWNETVKKEDTVYYLGDFCLQNKEYTEKILRRLHGKKHLILGNHDKSLKGLEHYFESVSQIKECKFTNNQFPFIDKDETFCVEMCHFPLLTWNRRNNGSVHVHGHCHGSCDDINDRLMELRVDVGIDSPKWNYKMIEVEELYQYFINLRNKLNCKTFTEYTTKLIDEHNAARG